jgi:DNA (cytosine-5)-methyltransferase 1
VKPTVGSLFAGIGGFDLGFERAGFETVWQVEIDPWCRKVLAKNFPEAERHGDIRECCGLGCEVCGRTSHLAKVDVICGGFPCQDISLAGAGAGIEGARSGLVTEMVRIIGELRPRIVLMENVAALLGRGLREVLGYLAEIGYDAEWEIVSAADVGAPHRRERIWILAYASGGRCCRSSSWQVELARRTTSECGSEAMADAARIQSGWPQQWSERERVGASRESLAESSNSEDSIGRRPSEEEYSRRRHKEIGRLGQCGRGLQHWFIEPNVGRVAHGIPAELDFIRRVIGGEIYSSETEPAARELIWKILRQVWEQRETAKTSPLLYRRGLCDLVPDMPQDRARDGWLLGCRIDEDEELRGVWEDFYAQPYEEAQNMLPSLLERIGAKKRPQALGSRVDRLRGLGNAVVPQIPELYARRIKQLLDTK